MYFPIVLIIYWRIRYYFIGPVIENPSGKVRVKQASREAVFPAEMAMIRGLYDAPLSSDTVIGNVHTQQSTRDEECRIWPVFGPDHDDGEGHSVPSCIVWTWSITFMYEGSRLHRYTTTINATINPRVKVEIQSNWQTFSERMSMRVCLSFSWLALMDTWSCHWCNNQPINHKQKLCWIDLMLITKPTQYN